MSLLPLLFSISAAGSVPSGHQPAEAYNLHFAQGSAQLSPIAEYQLQQAARQLNETPYLAASIVGYGPAGDDDAPTLGDDRVAAIRDYVVSRRGIDPGRLILQGAVATSPEQDGLAVLTVLVPSSAS